MTLRDRPGRGETYGELMQRNHLADVEALGSWTPPPLDTPHGLLTFGAQFAEVAVDPDLGLVRVRRMVGAFAPGRVLNPKLARSQLMGGMLWGLGQALLEGNRMDARYGRWGASNLARVPRARQRGRPGRDVELVEVSDASSTRSGSRASARSGRSAPRPRSPTPSSTPRAAAIRELPLAAELVMDPARRDHA